jgi:hypothetical protein
MLSRRQRVWDAAIRDLGIDPASLEKGADPAVAIDGWRRIARYLETQGLGSEAGEAWDWAVSEALDESSFDEVDERVLWEASAFYERHDALGSLRATLEQAWAATRNAPGGVSTGFAVRLLTRLSGAYEKLRMPEQAREAAARAAVIAELAVDGRTAPVRRCA